MTDVHIARAACGHIVAWTPLHGGALAGVRTFWRQKGWSVESRQWSLSGWPPVLLGLPCCRAVAAS